MARICFTVSAITAALIGALQLLHCMADDSCKPRAEFRQYSFGRLYQLKDQAAGKRQVSASLSSMASKLDSL
jgi:hypothetical protein